MRSWRVVLAVALLAGCSAAPRSASTGSRSADYLESDPPRAAWSSEPAAIEAASAPALPSGGFPGASQGLWIRVDYPAPGHEVRVWEDAYSHRRYKFHIVGGFLVSVEPA
jgi:hypothetical protein